MDQTIPIISLVPNVLVGNADEYIHLKNRCKLIIVFNKVRKRRDDLMLTHTDEHYRKTQWTKLKEGGLYSSYKLVSLNSDRMQFQVLLRGFFSILIFPIIGFILIILALFGKAVWGIEGFEHPGVIPFGLVFILTGLFLLYRMYKEKITIDRSYPAMWRGNGKVYINPQSLEGYVSLKNLQAIQILETHVGIIQRSSNMGAIVYEINFVFSDGERIHVVAEKNVKRTLQQSQKLADFLGVPLSDKYLEIDEDLKRHYRKKMDQKIAVAIVLIAVFAWFIYHDIS